MKTKLFRVGDMVIVNWVDITSEADGWKRLDGSDTLSLLGRCRSCGQVVGEDKLSITIAQTLGWMGDHIVYGDTIRIPKAVIIEYRVPTQTQAISGAWRDVSIVVEPVRIDK